MRTIRTIKSGSKEKEEYYTNDESLKKDEYYSETEMESAEYKVTTAQWMGPKAASLGLTGMSNRPSLSNCSMAIYQEPVNGLEAIANMGKKI
ncbi:MAG: hypothetical protein HC852_23925 [Acaryochloridaceae cyanobacterium RU_4_10]|nr:hypothetical protein [Acaryochloridaceae cyanobacterium RU_4_10]